MFSRSGRTFLLLVIAAISVLGCKEGLKFVPPDGGPGGVAGKGSQGGGSGAAGSGTAGVMGVAGSGGPTGGTGMGPPGGAGGAGGPTGENAGASGHGGLGGTDLGEGGAAEPGVGGAMASGGNMGLGGRIGAGGDASGVGGGGRGGATGTGGVACSQTLCGSSCVDTKSDPRNCGSCAHDCMAGTCSFGKCQPVLIGRYDRYLGENSISLSDEYVYGKSETTLVLRAKKDGTSLATAPLPTFATSGCPGGGVEEVDGRVFYQWNDGTTCRIAVCSTSDCDGTTQGISSTTPSSYVQSFVADRAGSRLFWFDATAKRFMTVSTKGTTVPTPTPLSSVDLVVSRAWTGYAAGGIFFDEGTSMYRMPAAGGVATRLFDSADIATATLWPTGSHFFWSANSTIDFIAIPTTSMNPQTIIAMSAKHLWGDDTDLYWDSDGLNIQHCSLVNCQATTALLASSPCTIVSIRGDSGAIYWGGYGTCKEPISSAIDKAQLWKVAR